RTQRGRDPRFAGSEGGGRPRTRRRTTVSHRAGPAQPRGLLSLRLCAPLPRRDPVDRRGVPFHRHRDGTLSGDAGYDRRPIAGSAGERAERMRDSLPALSLVAVPGRRRLTLDVACEAERRGFAGLYVPSIFGNMAQSTALALATERVIFGTA